MESVSYTHLNLEQALGGRKPDYLIVQHMAPDHAANVANLSLIHISDIVNASMNVLQRSTVLLVSAVAVCIAGLFIGIILRKNRVNLKRKDTEILYRDEYPRCRPD